MAQQEGGWPLGLQPLNVRVGLLRNLDFSGSLSLNTIITDDSPTSSSSASSSSDIDTESTGSFFPDRSITLGNLIGITNILELSRRSLRRSKKNQEKNPRRKKTHKTKTWFSLCPRAHLNHETPCSSINAPSLGHFLEAERRASNVQGSKKQKKKKKKKKSSSMVYEIDELIIPERVSSMEEESSLFSNGVVAPPPPPHEVEGNE
ncbi:Uncharacterized protein ACMD2_02302, partial [Ananas comosus]